MAIEPWGIDVVRADDMLVLSFEFHNLVEVAAEPGFLTRAGGGDSFLVVRFPAQHIAESHFAQGQAPADDPVAAVLAEPSRLVFAVPTGTRIPYSIDGLLGWAGLSLRVVPNAVPHSAERKSAAAGDAPRAPKPLETAIEIPYRVVLSPDKGAAWAHATAAVTHGNVTELWHTRLGVPGPERVDESARPAVRVVWSRHTVDPPAPTLLPDSAQRRKLTLSADFSQKHGADGFYVPPALATTRLFLTALGGWFEAQGEWEVPGDHGQQIGWRHIATGGRDQFVRVDQKGFLAPFGHRAVLTSIAERKPLPAAGGMAGYLMRRDFLTVLQPTKEFSASPFAHGGREFPFRSVTIRTARTPLLSNGGDSRPMVPKVDGTPFRFHLVGVDGDGNVVDFEMPLQFLEQGAAYDVTAYNGGDFPRDGDFRGQTVAYLPAAPLSPAAGADGTPDVTGSTAFPTKLISFAAQEITPDRRAEVPDDGGPAFLPVLGTAEVTIASINRLLGPGRTPAPTTIAYLDAYLTAGLPDSGPDAFAKFVGGSLPLAIPAERAGGLAAPAMALDGLSRSLGPVSAVESFAARNFEGLRDLLDGELLGGITLRDIVGEITLETVPKLVTRNLPDVVETSFEWKPNLRLGNPLLKANPGTSLSLVSVVRTPVGSPKGAGPTAEVHGMLTNFSLTFAGVLEARIDKLEFRAAAGQKVDLNVEGISVTFQQELAFLNPLAALLHVNGFSDPPFLDVTSSGVVAGYTLGIPAAGAGYLSIENIALSAALSLPFDGRPLGFRFAFSDRHNPFLCSVSGIAGGGFVAIGVSSRGIERIEAALEFGGNITIGLGIVTANVHVLAGFYFGLQEGGDKLSFTGYLRIGGSVDLLGLVTVSIEFYLGLTLEGDFLVGKAEVTVGVHVLFVDKEFTLSVSKQFGPLGLLNPLSSPTALGGPKTAEGTPSPHPFEDLITPEDWLAYCRAFA